MFRRQTKHRKKRCWTWEVCSFPFPPAERHWPDHVPSVDRVVARQGALGTPTALVVAHELARREPQSNFGRGVEA